MKPIFADAFYFVALLNRADQYHSKAAAFAMQFRGELITTQWILMEVADALAEAENRRVVISFIRQISADPNVKVISADSESFAKGFGFYAQRLDKNWSLTDCISFVVMKAEKLTEALTGDRHFEQAGFNALLA